MRRLLSRTNLHLHPSEFSSTRPRLVLRESPDDPIALANALVLKNPPLDSIGRNNMPNFIKALHSELEKTIGRSVMLPNLHHSKFVGIFSDYGGDEKSSSYHTYSFLFVALDIAMSLGVLRDLQAIRAQHGLLSPHREMAFKNLDYGPLARALPQWLEAIDNTPGLLFTLVVDKQAKSVVTRNSKESLQALVGQMIDHKIGSWTNIWMAERFLRIAHSIAYWCSLLCRQDQQVIWITDNDNVTANESMMNGLRQAVFSAAAQYRKDLHLKFALGSEVQLPTDSKNMKELVSYPDLVAGSVGNAFTCAISQRGSVKTKIAPIIQWLCWQKVGMKKVTFLTRPIGDKLWGGIGNFEHTEVPDDVGFIPITSE